MATRNADDYIRKIEGLLKNASDPALDDKARENYQAKADALMFQYRIDRAMLFKSGATTAAEVIVRTYGPTAADGFVGTTNQMRDNLFMHMGCMVHDGWSKTTVVGYEEEIRVAEMMWAQVFLHFTQTVFPKWENFKTFDANVYDLKSAGYSWPYVREAGLKHDAGDAAGKLTAKNAGSKLRTAFKREATRRGEVVLPGRQQPANSDKWRRSFAEAYSYRLLSRLAEMKRHNEEEAGENALALVSEQDKIKQQFYALFPDRNPEVRKRRQEESKAREAARWNALTPEEQEAERKAAKKENDRWARRAARQSPYYDDAGWDAGKRAADKADLGQGKVAADNGRALE